MILTKWVIDRLKKYGFFFFKQKTAYEFVDCDWSSDVCSSDLVFSHLSHRMGKHRDVEKELPNNVQIAHDGLTITV